MLLYILAPQTHANVYNTNNQYCMVCVWACGALLLWTKHVTILNTPNYTSMTRYTHEHHVPHTEHVESSKRYYSHDGVTSPSDI